MLETLEERERHHCGCCSHWQGYSAFLPHPEDNKAFCFWPQIVRGIDQPKKPPVFAKGVDLVSKRMYPDEGGECSVFLDSGFPMPEPPGKEKR